MFLDRILIEFVQNIIGLVLGLFQDLAASLLGWFV